MSFLSGSLRSLAARAALAAPASAAAPTRIALLHSTAASSSKAAASPLVAAARTRIVAPAQAKSVLGARTYASHEADESFEGFTARYVSFFDAVEDLFELQRGLNNCFSYDLVPAPEVIESALRASRRVNDFSTAVRIFDGIKEKVENNKQYEQYLEALKPVREELGINTREEFYGN
ncbi:COX5A-domain-containing protein [Microstroma glucosiphilum]|uniref:Cytochrome c oxidase subunit 6, mitochondrial n=1 Tax=Pseudomicrostroma glucosiphilum TaxID=1684307 RepID=A0A316U6V5_9BASI|nr:COX5A-domain-containing protein [Pseudomicrostroma glucosiphilum]PWN20960.1 COX5A-domain-containing protein [Pseudomicrostroma glucosiphilum]